MKHIYYLTIALLALAGNAVAQQPQNALQATALVYLRMDPDGLSKDELAAKLEQRHKLFDVLKRERSADSLFYMRGSTHDFNPFSIQVSQVEFQVREARLQLSDDIWDTVVVIQVIGITDSTEDGQKLAVREYKDMNRLLRKNFHLLDARGDDLRRNKSYEKSYYSNSYKSWMVCTETDFGRYYRDGKSNAISVTMMFHVVRPNEEVLTKKDPGVSATLANTRWNDKILINKGLRQSRR